MADQGTNYVSGELNLGIMAIDHIPTCSNLNIQIMVHQIDVTLVQMSQCPSARTTAMQPADARIMRRLFTELHGWYDLAKGAALSPQYLPNYDPTPLHVAEPPNVNRVNNPHIMDYMNHVAALRTQLLASPGNKQSTGFHPGAIAEVYDPFFEDLERHVTFCEDHVGDPQFTPELDTPALGSNPGSPR